MNLPSNSPNDHSENPPHRRGAVAVIVREGRFLVIRRSQTVVAPGRLCFPGGGIEGGESEEQALIRELQEELGVIVQPVRRVWQSVTPWRVELAWWLAELEEQNPLIPNPAEVEEAFWHTPEELLALEGLLESNISFLAALAAGEIRLE